MDVAGVLKREFVFWGPPVSHLPKILNQENLHPLRLPAEKCGIRKIRHPLASLRISLT